MCQFFSHLVKEIITEYFSTVCRWVICLAGYTFLIPISLKKAETAIYLIIYVQVNVRETLVWHQDIDVTGGVLHDMLCRPYHVEWTAFCRG